MGCTDVSDLKTCSETDVTEKSNFPIRRKDGIRLIDVDGWSRLAIVLCKCSVGEKNNPEMRHSVRQSYMWSIMSARVARS